MGRWEFQIQSLFFHGLDFEQNNKMGNPFEAMSRFSKPVKDFVHSLRKTKQDQRAINAVLEEELGSIAPLSSAPKRKM